MKLVDGLWGGLSFEIVEQVLAFLPVPDLCRYRTVCKKWNRLICEGKFAACCTQNAKDSEASYIVARYYLHNPLEPSIDLERGVSIFDLKARRWYTIPKDDEWRTDSGILVADGGMVCQYKWEPLDSYSKLRPIIVYNPIAATKTFIPGPHLQNYLGYDHPKMAMTVDPVTCNYKIFLIRAILGSMHTISAVHVCIYNSATKKWVVSSQPPRKFGDKNMCLCSVAHQDKLYILIAFSPFQYRICCYTISQDSWDEVGVEIHERYLCFPELIVSKNRLFLKTWYICEEKYEEGHEHGEQVWQLEVSEILIPDRTRVTIFEMANALVLQVFGVECARDMHFDKRPHTNVFFFRNSIILMAQLSGVSMLYDMVSRTWHLLPRNPLGPLSGASGNDKGYYLHAKQTNIILPTTRW